MNREIKFRAWVKEDSEMKGYFIPHDSHELNYSELIDVHNENECTILMQFTGLHDKNGKEIYEGDIVKNWQGGWNVVVYKSPSFEATVSEEQSSSYSKEWWDSVEIIGNIYETPELCS